MKELKDAILSQNHRRSQGVAQGVDQGVVHGWTRGWTRGPGHLNRNATNDKNLTKKALFLHFQFLLAFLRTTVHTYTSNFQ